MTLICYASEDNAEGQLNSGINAAATSIVLNAGEGAEFPQPYTGSASSTGDATTLNDTGDLANLAVGDFIRNVTDGSCAWVTVAGTNSVTTTRLRGGTLNVWTSADVWQVNEFVITIETRDASTPPVVTAREKVLISNRSTDTLTARTRGYDGSTAQSWVADDYVNLHVTSVVLEHMIDVLYTMAVRENTNQTDIATNVTDINNIESNATFYVAAAGSSNAFTGTLSSMPAAYTTGERLFFKANHEINGSATFNRAGLGAKTIKKLDGATNLASADIKNGQIVEVVYDGTNYLMVSPLGQAQTTQVYRKVVAMFQADTTGVGTSSTAEVDVPTHKYQIPANDLVADVGYFFVWAGTITWAAGTVNIRVRLGSVNIVVLSVIPTATTEFRLVGHIQGTAGAGASVAVRGEGEVRIVTGSTNVMMDYGTGNAATEGALDLQMNIDYTSNDGGNSFVSSLCVIEKVSETLF